MNTRSMTKTDTLTSLRDDILDHVQSYAGLPTDSEPVIISLNKELEIVIHKYDSLSHIPIKVSLVTEGNLLTGLSAVKLLIGDLEVEI